MKRRLEKHEIDNVFLLLEFTVFAGCVLMVLMLGANVYERIVTRDQDAYNARTGVQYIAARVRHADVSDSIQAGSFSNPYNMSADGIPTLYLKSSVGGENYYTRIYYYDGYIRELFSPENLTLRPEAGQEVIAASSFVVEQEGSMLRVIIGEEDGEQNDISLFIRSAERSGYDGTEE